MRECRLLSLILISLACLAVGARFSSFGGVVEPLPPQWENPTHTAATLAGQAHPGFGPACDPPTVPLEPGQSQITVGGASDWRFFAFTNATPFTNALFSLFHTRSSAPAENRTEPDADLYVSLEPTLAELDLIAISAAEKSLGRGGTEYVLLSNAAPAVYYLGVKAEQPQEFIFSVAAVMSEKPFSEELDNGDVAVFGFPQDVPIPATGGSTPQPLTLLSASEGIALVRRVLLTNTLWAPTATGLVSTVGHQGNWATLLHGGPAPGPSTVYDDSAEGDIPLARRSAGPGSLNDFGGQPGSGLWLFDLQEMEGDGLSVQGSTSLRLERQKDLLQGVAFELMPGASRWEWIDLPPGTVKLTVNASITSGAGPVRVWLCGEDQDEQNAVCGEARANHDATVVWDTTWDPPLNPGMQRIRFANTGTEPVSLYVNAEQVIDPESRPATVTLASTVNQPLADLGLSTASLDVTQQGSIAAVALGVRLEHPRLSDLALTLVSPQGTRVRLVERRGDCSREGMGLDTILTNVTPVSSSGGPEASTNVLSTGRTSGTIRIDYNMYALPDFMRVYYEGQLLFDSGLVSDAGTWEVSYGPGEATALTLVVNEGGNYDPDTAWDYVVTSTRPGWAPLTFAEEPGLPPIKFAPPPFTNVVAAPVGEPPLANYLPEESLDRFWGEDPKGEWRLELVDTQEGPTEGPSARLTGWVLGLELQRTVPEPIDLVHDEARTNWVGAAQTRYYRVDVPSWAKFATNTLWSSSAPVDLLFISPGPPDPAAPESFLATNVTAARVVLGASTSPLQIEPGQPYYLGIQHSNSQRMVVTLQVDFDVTHLAPGSTQVFFLEPGTPRYFAVDVATNAYAAEFRVSNLSADAGLVGRRGMPFPDGSSFEVASFNPGQADEVTLLGPDASGPRIAPGRWYFGVLNADVIPAEGTVRFEQKLCDLTQLQFVVWLAEAGELCFTWNSLPETDYQLQASDNLEAGPWMPVGGIYTATETWSTQCIPMAEGLRFFRIVEQTGP